MKPTMAESKGPIAEAAVSPTPVDEVRRLRSIEDLVAPLPSRFLAAFIDSLLIGFVFLPLFLLVAAAASNGNALFRAIASVVGLALILIAYHTILEGITGTTLGKWLLQIAVVREDCTGLGLRRSAVRNGMRLVDALPVVVPYLLGTIVALNNRKRQRLGDQAARSVVINV